MLLGTNDPHSAVQDCLPHPYMMHKEIHCQPVNELSEQIFKLGEHAVIGASPFNSYFTEQNLEKLLRWSFKKFESIRVFIPDGISAFTFKALGYSEEKSIKKTKRQDCYLENKVIRAFENMGILKKEAEQRILKVSELAANNKKYCEIYEHFLKKFENEVSFRLGCLSTSNWILANKYGDNPINDEIANVAVKYFLHELPLFLDSPGILGVNSSSFIYHVIPEYLLDIYNKIFLNTRRQGFLITTIMADASKSSIKNINKLY